MSLGSGPLDAAPTPPPPDPPIDAPSPIPDGVIDPDALIQVPLGCPTRDGADVAFVGTVLDKDEFIEKGTVRFQIDQVRAGSATPFSVDGVVDVRYGFDSQYLDVETQYFVSAAVDPDLGALSSKVSPEAPLFGGDAVVGVEDNEVVCPVIDDPIQTVNLDGTPIDSSLLKPLLEDRRLLLSTILMPASIVAAVLIGLVLLRRALDVGARGIVTLGRAAVTPTRDHRASQIRHHQSEMDADQSEWGDNGRYVEPSDTDETVDA